MASSAPRDPAPAESSLRQLPSVENCLFALRNDASLNDLSPIYLTAAVRKALRQLRAELTAASALRKLDRDSLSAEAIRRTRIIIQQDQPALRPVVNATGVIVHTNLGRALLAESAIEAMDMAARNAVNLEYQLESGARGDRDELVSATLSALTGAEAATVVNNNAAAVMLVLNTLAAGREVIVSRGELVEIGGSFRIPEIMASSGARLHEVGATNRTHLEDYARAISPDTAFLMKVHPSNYRIVGFTGEVALSDLVELGRTQQLDVVEDLGAGALVDLSSYGLAREPMVSDRIDAGAALVTFSGDKLIGGPQSGIVVGRRDLIERLKRNPMWRALRLDKLRLAALEATLRVYLRTRNPAEKIPALRVISRPIAEIEALATASREILKHRLGPDFAIAIVASSAEFGSGALPQATVESRALRITHPGIAAETIAGRFRRAGVVGRIHADGFQLDLRAIESAQAFARDYPP